MKVIKTLTPHSSFHNIFRADSHFISQQKPYKILPITLKFCTKLASFNSCSLMQHYYEKLHHLCISPARKVAHCLPSSKSEVHMDIETAGCSQTVRVKVELKKECQFGDSFLIVGDDPILGSWDPSDAIPLNWSEGHIWSLLLELPVDKSIQYKILLKKQTGEIMWQPGSDRSFQTWDTENVITVTEDWDAAEAQKISEQERISDENEEVTNGSLVVASILDSSKDDQLDRAPNKDNFSGAEDKTEVNLKQNPSSNTVKNGSKSVRSTQSKVSASKMSSDQMGKAETKEGNFVIADEGPVLVPGLSLPVSSSEDDFANGNQKSTHFNIH